MSLKYLNAKVTQQKSGNALLFGKCIFIKVQNSSSFEAQNEERHNWKSGKERAFTILTSLLRIFGITVYVKNKIKRKTLSNETERLKETLHFLSNHCQPSEHFQWLTETIKLWALQKTKPMDIITGKKKN